MLTTAAGSGASVFAEQLRQLAIFAAIRRASSLLKQLGWCTAPQTAKPSAMSENRRLCLSPYAPSFECSSEGRRWVFEPAFHKPGAALSTRIGGNGRTRRSDKEIIQLRPPTWARIRAPTAGIYWLRRWIHADTDPVSSAGVHFQQPLMAVARVRSVHFGGLQYE